MNRLKRSMGLLLALIMVVGMLTACGNNNTPTSTAAGGGDQSTADISTGGEQPSGTDGAILVIAVGASFEEKWNPFLVESAYDHEVVNQIFTPVATLDADNRVVPQGGEISYVENSDGTVTYTVKLVEGQKFTDGTPVTIDDYIYGIYVRADPSYTGPMSAASMPVVGMLEYFYDDPNYTTALSALEAEMEKYKTENISFDDFLAYMTETEYDPEAVAGYVDYIISVAVDFPTYNTTLQELTGIDATALGDEYDVAEMDLSGADPEAVFALYCQIEYDIYLEYYDVYGHYFEPKRLAMATGNLEDGVDVSEISGVTKVDDLTCEVVYSKYSMVADRDLGTNNGLGMLTPKHYYGEFEKGDVSAILANMEPMGSGPYIWGGFADNIATCTANNDYFQGTPVTQTVRWQYIPSSEVVTALANGEIDICEPSGNTANLQELERQGLNYVKYDNAGYGWLGMNTENQPLNVRKGLWSLLNRGPAVEGYYGAGDDAIARVIERPMSTVVAEYPQDATEYYAYSPEKALEYFEAAGYTQDANGKLVDANGNQLICNVYVGGEGKGDHPSYAMLVQAAEDLAALGGELQIQDVNFNVLQSAWNDGTADMVCMAWSQVNTCDKMSQFHSTGGQNKYRYSDAHMDELLEAIDTTADFDARAALVREMLDYAMDQCLEYPVYQRYNLQAYNEQTLDMSTIPETTPFYDYKTVLWQVAMTI